MENLCSSFFSFTSLAGVGGGVISSACEYFLQLSPFVSLTLRDSLTKDFNDCTGNGDFEFSTYLPAYLPTYLPTYLHTYIYSIKQVKLHKKMAAKG